MIALALPEFARRALGLPPEATQTARDVDALHAVVIATTLAGIFAIACVTFVFVARYRRRSAGERTPHIVASAKREWMIASAILALFLAFWFVGYRQYASIEQRPTNAFVVYVTAKQWMWQFTYADGRSAEDVLVVPEDTIVELVMTSRDVIHSLFVPAFRIKQDVLPGRYVSIWLDRAKPGSYPIYCAEFCGVSHSTMLGEVRVLDRNAFAAWRHAGPHVSLADRGRTIAAKKGCLACHTTDGQRHIGPTWSHLYGARVALDDGRTVVADEAYLTRSMMEPNADKVAGYSPVMPTYRGLLSAEETGALVELIRSLADAPTSPAVRLPALRVEALDGGTE
jgi:cytochrome c oxidase subunit 2